jgi:predicted glutamine amidotransferase
MCGIFGLITKNSSYLVNSHLNDFFDCLFKLSESRGKEAAGVAFLSDNQIKIYKKAVPASCFIKDKEYKELFKRLNDENCFVAIGHARLVTNGSMEINYNNQPVIKDRIVGIHNGIIVNDSEIWRKFPLLKHEYEVDTEAIIALVGMFFKKNKTITKAVKNTFDIIKGSASIAFLFTDKKCLLLATNTGSLYYYFWPQEEFLIFASERNILKKFLTTNHLPLENQISHLRAKSGLLIDIENLKIKNFFFEKPEAPSFTEEFNIIPANFDIIDLSSKENKISRTINKDFSLSKITSCFSLELDRVRKAIKSLRRCTKCILPETMPFIKFDENGVCNYCRSYKKIELKDKQEMEDMLKKYRSKNGEPDYLVSFSGGRDSCYGLHYIKNVLKMNPIAYSYDWGMITDLGRRNQARLCGKLGVEHILVSADIKKKRENIRENVIAWLKKPDLGMVPLFMAGDKHYFYYANKIMRENRIKINIMCENVLERTHFKHGFCGIAHRINDRPPYFLSLMDKIKIAFYYARQFIINPAYIQSSLFDSLRGYLSYYMIPHNYLYLYDYIKWDEKEIISTLIKEYDWETAADTKSTWRIGDGTASFYNYIYYVMAGFTENDTFRSNQIREGIIGREDALKIVEEENKPRYESIKWYCDTIGIDFEETLKIINSAPKIYKA